MSKFKRQENAEKVGFLICANCMDKFPPGKRFKVYATKDGHTLMESHVKTCK